MIIEIVYDYRIDVKSPPLLSWTYFYIDSEDKDKAITKAKSYFRKFCKEHGWVGKAKITGVDIIRKHDTLPNFITVPEQELPQKKNVKSDTTRTSTRVRQGKGTTSTKKPKVRGLSTKSGASDESIKSSRTNPSKNRRQTKSNQKGSRTTRK